MATSGYFITSGWSDSDSPDYYKFSWSLSSQSVSGNYSVISWSLTAGGGKNEYWWTNVKEKYVTVNGSTQSNSTVQTTYNGTTPFSGTTTIYHNSDGTKSFSASAGGAFYSFGSYNSTGSGTWSLPTIPRSSTISSITSSVAVGSTVTVNISRNSSSFTHRVRFYINDTYTSDVFSSVATSKSWTIPSSWYAAMPSSTQCVAHCNVATYDSNGNQVGSHVTKDFTVTVPSSIKPSVGTIILDPEDINGNNILVQGKNKVTLSVSGCSAGAGSKIKSYTISGPGISSTKTSTSTSTSVTSSVVSNIGTLTYTVTVTDNRNRSTSKTATITSYEYYTPSITSFNAYRANSNGEEDANGTYIKWTYGTKYASVNGTNNVTVKIYGTPTDAGTTTSSGDKCSGAEADKTYTVYAQITDSYGGSNISQKKTIPTQFKILNIISDGTEDTTGVAIGKMATTKQVLDSRWPIRSDAPEQTMKNLTYKGANTISSTTNDTTSNWGNQGNLATTFYNATGKITDQPSQYGFLLNLTNGPSSPEVHQLWATQSSGSLLHRGGNSSGWNGTWRTIVDSSNYTNYVSPKPVQLYHSGSGNVGTVTLSESAANFSYLEILYCDNNYRQHNSVKIYNPDGKYVSLSCAEPSTSGSEPRIYIRVSGWTISGTTMTPGRSDLSGENHGVYAQIYPHANGTNIDVKVTENNYIKIYRVLGYK